MSGGLKAVKELILKEQFHRWLTEEVLGDEWHEYVNPTSYNDDIPNCTCGEHHDHFDLNRTFTSWNDFGDVITAMKKNIDMFNSFINISENPLFQTSVKLINLVTDKDLFFSTLQEWFETSGWKDLPAAKEGELSWEKGIKR